MFRKMRRKKQELSREENIEILKSATSGVLAVLGDNDYPYAVPLSHVYDSGKLYFHCAIEGHKLDAVKNHSKASFCVIAQDDIIPEKYTTCYKSVIAFGKIHICNDEKEKITALQKMAYKFSPAQTEEQNSAEIKAHLSHTSIIILTIEHMTGKIAQELMMKRQKEL